MAYSAGKLGTNNDVKPVVTLTVPKNPGSRTPKKYVKKGSCGVKEITILVNSSFKKKIRAR